MWVIGMLDRQSEECHMARSFLSVLAAYALGGASAIVATQTEAGAATESSMALYAMDCGRFSMKDTDFYADDGSFKGVSRELVNPCYLIRHGSAYLLWDLGFPDGLATSRSSFEPRAGIVLTMEKSLVGQLEELHLKPADIDFVAISHSHFDHIGNGSLFERATFLVDEREHAWMFGSDARKEAQQSVGPHARELAEAYSVLERSKTVKIRHTESYDVFGDNSVTIHAAPGHTPGHRTLLVRLPGAGAVLLTGDMYHLAESREMRTVPRRNDRAMTLASMSIVEKLAAETKARVIRQHVQEDFVSLPAFPEALH
jgi:glyoxylase-like metal-dependent hydrolase (beta-lactamase superfamily II)